MCQIGVVHIIKKYFAFNNIPCNKSMSKYWDRKCKRSLNRLLDDIKFLINHLKLFYLLLLKGEYTSSKYYPNIIRYTLLKDMIKVVTHNPDYMEVRHEHTMSSIGQAATSSS